jgi:23S rRNA (guanine745-N1)-methyltransferase
VNAGPGHLLELRKIIYPDVRLTDSNQAAAAVRAGFRQLSHVPHRHTLSLPDQASINQLLSMTPHLFRASAQGKERARTLSELALGVDVVFDLLQSPTGQ